MELTAPAQRSGCVSFQIADEVAPRMIPMGNRWERAYFRDRWVYVEVGLYYPLLELRESPSVPNPGWGRRELPHGSVLAPAVESICSLGERGLTRPMVAREFLRQRVAPLQSSQPAWPLEGPQTGCGCLLRNSGAPPSRRPRGCCTPRVPPRSCPRIWLHCTTSPKEGRSSRGCSSMKGRRLFPRATWGLARTLFVPC